MYVLDTKGPEEVKHTGPLKVQETPLRSSVTMFSHEIEYSLFSKTKVNEINNEPPKKFFGDTRGSQVQPVIRDGYDGILTEGL